MLFAAVFYSPHFLLQLSIFCNFSSSLISLFLPLCFSLSYSLSSPCCSLASVLLPSSVLFLLLQASAGVPNAPPVNCFISSTEIEGESGEESSKLQCKIKVHDSHTRTPHTTHTHTQHTHLLLQPHNTCIQATHTLTLS